MLMPGREGKGRQSMHFVEDAKHVPADTIRQLINPLLLYMLNLMKHYLLFERLSKYMHWNNGLHCSCTQNLNILSMPKKYFYSITLQHQAPFALLIKNDMGSNTQGKWKQISCRQQTIIGHRCGLLTLFSSAQSKRWYIWYLLLSSIT